MVNGMSQPLQSTSDTDRANRRTLGQFAPKDEVFVLYSDSEWIGVEIGKRASQGEYVVRVIYTNDIPGYEVGQRLILGHELSARHSLTVRHLIALRDQREEYVP